MVCGHQGVEFRDGAADLGPGHGVPAGRVCSPCCSSRHLSSVEPVLAEEGLALEDHQRHAPMAGLALIELVLLDHDVQPLGRLVRGLEEVVGVEARPFGRLFQMVALLPVVGFAAPDQAADLVQKREPPPALGGDDAHAGQPVDVGLRLRVGPGGGVHIDRIGPRPADRQAQKRRLAPDIHHQIGGPQRVAGLEELRRSHRQRIDAAHPAAHIELGLQRRQARRDQVGVGRAERPEEIVGERHTEVPRTEVPRQAAQTVAEIHAPAKGDIAEG